MKKFISILLLIVSLLSLCACGLLTNHSKDATISTMETYLKEKYPDKNFTITNIEKQQDSTWYGVDFTDETNIQYLGFIDSSLPKEEAIKTARDNVQQNDINEAIIKEFKNIFAIDDITADNFITKMGGMFIIHEKFNGDIKDIFTKEKALIDYVKNTYNTTKFVFNCNIINKQPQITELSKEQQLLLSFFNITFTNFNSNIDKITINKLNETARKLTENLILTVPYIDCQYIYLTETNKFEKVEMDVKQKDKLFYFKRKDVTMEASPYNLAHLNPDTKEIIVISNDIIDKTLLEDNFDKNYTIISPLFTSVKNNYYYFDISEFEDTDTFTIFQRTNNGYEKSEVDKESFYYKENCIVGNYLFISENSFMQETEWFIAKNK